MFLQFLGGVVDQMAWIENAAECDGLPYRTWLGIESNSIVIGWHMSMEFWQYPAAKWWNYSHPFEGCL